MPNGIGSGSGIRFRRAGAAAFLPSDISGLQLWVKSDTGVTKDGSNNVSQWDDQSGNTRNLSEATNQPLWVDAALNGYPVIRFDGTNDKLSATGFSVSQPLSIFIVCKVNTHTNLDGIIFGANTSSVGIRMQSSPTINLEDETAGAGATASDTAAYELLKAVINGTSSVLAVNDGADQTSATNLTSTLNGGVRLAVWPGGAIRFGAIDVAEVAIYNSSISGTNLTNLKSYFNSRYVLW
jgi:hypothetical protein